PLQRCGSDNNSGLNMSIDQKHIFHTLNLTQRPLDVIEQVGLRFEPGREAHQRVANAELGPRLGLKTRMRRRRRMGDEALRVAEVVRNVDEPQRVEKTEAARLVAGDVKRDEATALRHLPP